MPQASFRKQARGNGTKRGREGRERQHKGGRKRRRTENRSCKVGQAARPTNRAWKAAPRGRWKASKQSDGCHFQLHSLGPKRVAGISLRRWGLFPGPAHLGRAGRWRGGELCQQAKMSASPAESSLTALMGRLGAHRRTQRCLCSSENLACQLHPRPMWGHYSIRYFSP